MAISVVGTPQTGAKTDGTDVTLSPGACAVGDILLVYGGTFNRAGITPGPTGTVTGFTAWRSVYRYTAGNPMLDVSWCRCTSAQSSPSVTCKGSANAADGVVYGCYVLRGVNPNLLDANNAGNNGFASAGPTASTNPNPPAVTTLTNAAWTFICAISSVRDTAVTAPTNYTTYHETVTANASTNDYTLAGSIREVATAGSEDPASWTGWATSTWLTVTLSAAPAKEASDAVRVAKTERTLPRVRVDLPQQLFRAGLQDVFVGSQSMAARESGGIAASSASRLTASQPAVDGFAVQAAETLPVPRLAQIVVDDAFDRADDPTGLGPNYLCVGFSLVSGRARVEKGVPSFCFAQYAAAVPMADQWAQVKVITLGVGDPSWNLLLCLRGNDWSGGLITTFYGGWNGSANQYVIGAFVDSVDNGLAAVAGTPPAVDDVFRFEVDGEELVLSRNGQFVTSAKSSLVQGAGRAGIWVVPAFGTFWELDDFKAGDWGSLGVVALEKDVPEALASAVGVEAADLLGAPAAADGEASGVAEVASTEVTGGVLLKDGPEGVPVALLDVDSFVTVDVTALE